jgi:signal transduction histidine kinase
MDRYVEYLLDLVSRLAGGRGGIEGGLVSYVLAGFAWGVLFVLAFTKCRRGHTPREKLLVWGFALAFSREAFMFGVASLQALEIVRPQTLHIIFPPLEHAMFDAALLVVVGAFLRYILHNTRLSSAYILVSLATVIGCYLATFWWWAQFVSRYPDTGFGQTWCNWAFHINASVWLAVAIVVFARAGSGWLRRLLLGVVGAFFLNEFLKIPDMATGEVYGGVFGPIRHGLYLASIPMLAMVYVRERSEEARRLHREIAQAAETERRQIGQNLHDTLGQDLAAIACLSSVLERRLGERDSSETERATRIVALTNQATRHVRSLARGMNPTGGHPEGLLSGLREIASDTSELFGISCAFQCDTNVLIRDVSAADHVYHIAQEAVTNAIRHGQTKTISLRLKGRNGWVLLEISDDGIGMSGASPHHTGMGIRIMEYRARTIGAKLRVSHNTQGGVTVACRMPKRLFKTTANTETR